MGLSKNVAPSLLKVLKNKVTNYIRSLLCGILLDLGVCFAASCDIIAALWYENDPRFRKNKDDK